jgi:protein ImuB
MGHRGCINAASLPLQILLQKNPEWSGAPVAVTREERPRSPILALNAAARKMGLSVGMPYASALALVPQLRARAVAADLLADTRESMVTLLRRFTPDVEPCPFNNDSFWVSVDGLRSLFASERSWVEKVRGAFISEGFRVNVVVGFTRFGTYAIARSRPGSLAFASPEEERVMMGRSSVEILPLQRKTKSILRKLEIRTVQQFLSLPAGETAQRLGKEAGLLRKAILSDDPLPIQPVAAKETMPCRRHLDCSLSDLALLTPHVEELLEVEAGRVEDDKCVISALILTLRTEEGGITTEVIRPAAPTLRLPVLRRLVHLRLSALQFSSGVVDIEITSTRSRPSRRQEELFISRGRDLQAGARAFAAIRARFGNESVTCAQLRDSYVPERSFSWAELTKPVLPAAGGRQALAGSPTAVRRILFAPAQRAAGSLHDPALAGPFVVSGAWWGGEGQSVLRDYRFQESTGGILWTYVDRLARGSWLQGIVD